MKCPDCGGEMMEIIKAVPHYKGKRGIVFYPSRPKEALGYKCIQCGREIREIKKEVK